MFTVAKIKQDSDSAEWCIQTFKLITLWYYMYSNDC